MLPAALAWLRTAQECFDDEHGSLTSGLLTSVAMLVVGLERVFHLEEMEDLGFALLSESFAQHQRHDPGFKCGVADGIRVPRNDVHQLPRSEAKSRCDCCRTPADDPRLVGHSSR